MDKRANPNDPKKHDHAYKLWLQAREIYIAKYEHDPVDDVDVLTMLKEENYYIETWNADSGPAVSNLKFIRPKR
jgi:hypothetical protein